jgi:DNA-binding NarL/FixJ family response regulator
MNLTVVTPIRLFGEGLAACFRRYPDISLQAVVPDLARLTQALGDGKTEIILIDVTQGVELDDVRAIAVGHPGVALVTLGLEDQRQDVIRCGRAGFSGYVARKASIDELYQALSDVMAGRLSCSAEISGGLLRALFRLERQHRLDEGLTQREGEVLHLIGQGMSNKEIARDLGLSISTVKHHVHHVLEKLKLPRRAQAMRRVRETPWIAALPAAGGIKAD